MGRVIVRILLTVCVAAAAAGPAWSQLRVSRPADTITMVDSKISIDVQDADIQTVLRSLAEFGGKNIIAGPEVKGDITVRLREVPWDEALDIILRANGYGWESSEGGVIRVTTVKNLQTESLERESAERKKEDLMPLATRIFRIKFAKAAELETPLQTSLTNRGEIKVEPQSNALVVKEIEQNLDRIAQMIDELDVQTLQVEITARLVDVDTKASKELGVTWTATGLNRDGIDATGDVTVNAPVGNPIGTFRVGTSGPGGNLDVALEALASKNKAHIISNPRITTLDNQSARILVGKKIPLIVSDAAGNPITQLTTIGIQMTVVPHVNSNNMITMDLHPEVSDLSSQATVQGGIIIVTSEAATRVMVNDGETAVIGGLIRSNEAEREDGVPLLKDIPLFGNLFKSSNTTKESRELLILVTPRIVRDVGMGGSGTGEAPEEPEG
jgi:type IV pilus assembly protein PilQ